MSIRLTTTRNSSGLYRFITPFYRDWCTYWTRRRLCLRSMNRRIHPPMCVGIPTPPFIAGLILSNRKFHGLPMSVYVLPNARVGYSLSGFYASTKPGPYIRVHPPCRCYALLGVVHPCASSGSSVRCRGASPFFIAAGFRNDLPRPQPSEGVKAVVCLFVSRRSQTS
jgi:hypothetical protein